MNKLYEGTISCKALLENPKRICICLYVDKKKRTKDFRYIIHLAQKRNCKVVVTNRDQLDQMASSKTHGGMLLEAKTRQYDSPQKINGWSVYIDGLEDPYNLGSVCRTLYAAGCDGLILPFRDWQKAETIILRSSAGAFEKLPIYMVKDDEALIQYLNTNDIPLYCAYRNQAQSLYDITFPDICCIAIGGAYRGLSRTLLDHAYQNVYIEYGRDFRNALDTASACAVFGFEIMRKRRNENANQSR